ncbi:MAG TPA: FKBP-type peptidyl-prolyl cis-trans isomerase [Pseudomonadales bacterium]|nr:FKBP-type peptidyl-prolyl cis-trans isomerase [Pseudomonadales bacterium]
MPSQVAGHARATSVARIRIVVVAGLLLAGAACQKPPPPQAKGPALETDVAKASYGLGYNIAGNVGNQYGKALDSKAFVAGVEDGFAGTSSKVSEEAVLAALNALNDARAEERGKLAETNLAAAKAYLAENAKKPGVTTTASGLQYEVLTAGNGPKPTLSDTVTTNYTGTLINGTVFDSSVERGTPATFPVNGVIPGWVEALQLMNVGSKWRIVIPPELAYKERGAGNRIGPNEALIFEVELLAINPS